MLEEVQGFGKSLEGDGRDAAAGGKSESFPRFDGVPDDAERGFASDAESGTPSKAPHRASLPSGFVELPPDFSEGLDDAVVPDEQDDADADQPVRRRPILTGPIGRPRSPRALAAPVLDKSDTLTPTQRLLILDTWKRSGLPAGDFAGLVGISKHTLYAWKKRFDEQGPSGLMDRPRGAGPGSKLPDLTRRTILMLKESNPEWGCQRISDMLTRGPALPASPSAVAKVLHDAGYQMEEVSTRPHPTPETRFERARPQQLWQTDLFTFVLKRQNRRVYLVAFMDDHSRFIVGYGLHASQSAALVLEVLRAAIAGYGVPEEVLTDNGTQYVTWRGKSAFTKECEKQGIRQIVAKPRRPQTLGKIERFWGTLWKECVEAAVFQDLGDARQRIGLFIDYYNFQRVHQGIEGLAPAPDQSLPLHAAHRLLQRPTASSERPRKSRRLSPPAWQPTPWNWRNAVSPRLRSI